MIKIDHITKEFLIYNNASQILQSWINRKQSRIKTFTALHDIHVNIKAGERVALIGTNGAGKTTLLRLIAGSLKPTKGKITVKGNISAIMKTGVGMFDNFTGYENILSGLIYAGIPDKNYQDAIYEIVDFCELGEYLHRPLKHYSLGMKARLQFAIATAVEPEVLLIDEILASGDPYFLMKSQKRLEKLIFDKRSTLILVSHSTQQVRQFCDRTIWLREGHLFDDANTHDVIKNYEVYIENLIYQKRKSIPKDKLFEFKQKLDDGRKVHRWPSKMGIKIADVDLKVNNQSCSHAQLGDDVHLYMNVRGELHGTLAVRYLITFWNQRGKRIARIENHKNTFKINPEELRPIHVQFKNILPPGEYSISISIYDNTELNSTVDSYATRLDTISHCFTFHSLLPKKLASYSNILPHQWKNVS